MHGHDLTENDERIDIFLHLKRLSLKKSEFFETKRLSDPSNK